MIIVKTLFLVTVFWLAFISVMGLKERWGILSIPVKVIGAPFVLAFVVADVVLNYTLFTVIFFDLPEESTFTKRLERYYWLTDWRGKSARIICQNFLDPFEIGGHCKKA